MLSVATGKRSASTAETDSTRAPMPLNCLDRAASAERRALEATNDALRIDNEHMAQSWRHLAKSYEFVQSVERFLLDMERAKNDLITNFTGTANGAHWLAGRATDDPT